MKLHARHLTLFLIGLSAAAQNRPRALDIGLHSGTMPPGPLDAITDVAGVRVGHTTLNRGAAIRTGVTIILPPGENLFRDKVPAGVSIGNAFGKLAGSTQVQELGEIETPIALTSTLNVPPRGRRPARFHAHPSR